MSEGNGFVTGRGVWSKEKQSRFSFEYVSSLLSYNAKTGGFVWRVDRGRFRCAGKRAGHLGTEGYWILKIDGYNFQGQRVAWLLKTGNWPDLEVDHEDTNRANNRWENLRQATHGQNQSNGVAYKNNTLGVKGVSPMPKQPGRFRVRIRKDGIERHIGCFNSLEEAGVAYASAAQELHGRFGRSS